MSAKSSILSLIAIVVLTALFTSSQGASRSASIPDRERKVVEAAIEQFIIRGRPLVQTASHVRVYQPGTPILVSEQTWSAATTSEIKIPPGQEEAFRDYRERNRETGSWDRPPSLTVTSEFAPPLFTSMADYWNQLSRAYPAATGVLTPSRPGFSADGQSAWVKIHINTGSGTSPRMDWWVHLRKAETGWSMLETLTLTDDDHHFARLPSTISQRDGLLWKYGAEGSYEERVAGRRLVEAGK